jgi:hypothetical protein
MQPEQGKDLAVLQAGVARVLAGDSSAAACKKQMANMMVQEFSSSKEQTTPDRTRMDRPGLCMLVETHMEHGELTAFIMSHSITRYAVVM